MEQLDVAVIGAGAAGMTAAVAAAREARERGAAAKIVLFEKEKLPGKKLLATGNGRCNLANRDNGAAHYVGDARFIEEAYRAFSPEEALRFLRSIGVPAADDGSGRLYPVSRRAGAVVAALRAECARCGAEIRCGTPVVSVKKTDRGFSIDGRYLARRLIFAAGGDAGLRRGERCAAFDLLASLGVGSTDRCACLCGLKLADWPASLKGVRNICLTTLSAGGKTVFTERGEVQFNADGVSGIPVMQGSLRVSPLLAKGTPCRLTLDLLPDVPLPELTRELTALAKRYPAVPAELLFGGYLPKPLCVSLIKKTGVSPAEAFPPEKAAAFAALAKRLSFDAVGTAGFPDAQVSGGGVMTEQLDPSTMEVRSAPGLYVVGETLDVTGACGGYNLTWAWCSGYVAGRAAGRSVSTGRSEE